MTLVLLLLRFVPPLVDSTGQGSGKEGTHLNVEMLRKPSERIEGQILQTSLYTSDVVRREVEALGKGGLREFLPAPSKRNSAPHLLSKVVCWGRNCHAPKLVDPALKVN